MFHLSILGIMPNYIHEKMNVVEKTGAEGHLYGRGGLIFFVM